MRDREYLRKVMGRKEGSGSGENTTHASVGQHKNILQILIQINNTKLVLLKIIRIIILLVQKQVYKI